MTMARSGASHTAWRELIAARLDRPLTRAETRALAAHLHDCAACRAVDHDYREQRVLLRALPPRPAPRDLWPRTSAALDREVARASYRGGRPWRGLSFDHGLPSATRRASAPSAALVTTLAALGVIAALGVTQLMPTFETQPPRAPGQATPFAVAPQPLAFIGNQAADLYIYQTDVGHVCPPTAPDCAVDDDIVRRAVKLPASVHARNIALSPSGEALAVVGRGLNRDVIAVVMLGPRRGGQPNHPNGSDATPKVTPAASDLPDGSAEPSATTRPPAESSPPPPPTATTAAPSADPGLRVVAILEDVESAGAPPAWSPSGQMLAFSAMPADGSHGPDVYVWSPSVPVAQPITSDHGSYFASWSGERIVASRVVAQPDAGGPQLSTIVIDPGTLEQRDVGGPPLWLPVVNPARSHAVAWRGELALENGVAVPRTGTLYMIEWAAIDPFAPGNEAEPTPPASIEATPTPTLVPPSTAPSTSPTETPTSSANPTAAAPTTEPTSPPETPNPTPSETTSSAPTETPATPDVTEQPTAPLPAGSVPLDLGRDTTSAPVVDWQVRWSIDGQVLGIWIADAEASTWGRLTVLAVDPETHQLGNADPLLSPTLARRGFTLGLSRVAWVAPSEDDPDGELRIRTWGNDGVGGLRLQPSELEEVLPAF
jgi:hypothetical protein